MYIVSTLGRSGPTNQLYGLIKYLDRKEFDPYIVTLSPEPDDSRWADCETLGVHLYSLGLSRLQGFLCAKERIKSLVADIRPDVVHTQGIRGEAISSGLKIKIPKMATIHNMPQFDYIMTYGYIIGSLMCFWHTKILKEISLCIGISEAVSINLEKTYKIKNVVTIQNGVETDIFFPATNDERRLLRRKLNLPLTGNIFISCGYLSKLKDPLFLIDMWIKIFDSKSDNYLVFIGSGNLQEECIRKSFNSSNIHIAGRINNVPDYLKCGDYFISTSHAEGLPYAVLEAMACGLPVLLSDIEAHKEIIAIAPDAGFCYQLGNGVNFLDMLNKITTVDKYIMGRASSEAVYNHFNAKKMSEAYQRSYSDLYSLTVKPY